MIAYFKGLCHDNMPVSACLTPEVFSTNGKTVFMSVVRLKVRPRVQNYNSNDGKFK